MRPAAWLLSALAAAGLVGAAAAALPSPLDRQRERLRDAKLEADRASGRAEALERQAGQARTSAERIAARRKAMTARIDAAAADYAEAQARVTVVARLLAERRGVLAERRQPIVRLMAALQSLARRPLVASVAQPGSTADAVHVRAILSTVMPAVRSRTSAVRQGLADIQRTRRQAQLAAAALGSSRDALEQQRLALVRLEAEQRLRSRDLGRTALVESDRAIALGEHARDIVDQMEETQIAAATAEDLAALPGPLPRPGDTPAPQLARSPYRLPVSGRLVTGFGEVSPAGVRARGLTLAVAPGASVLAPIAGRVAFVRRFRGYGGVLILDHGAGWTTTVTGVAAAAVRVGAEVRQGTPLGRAGRGEAPQVTVELRRRGVPVDVAALLG